MKEEPKRNSNLGTEENSSVLYRTRSEAWFTVGGAVRERKSKMPNNHHHHHNHNHNHSNSKLKTKSILKSTRKPLRDVSNGDSKLPPSPSKSPKKKAPVPVVSPGDDSLDRLLLVHSDLTSIIHQIDELVVQALKVTSERGRQDVQSFANDLSMMRCSLKSWVPRLRALSTPSTGPKSKLELSVASGSIPAADDCLSTAIDSPDQTKLDTLVSPSPLVSWHAGCTTQSGRQLFLLTPLTKSKSLSSKLQKIPSEKITPNTTAALPSLLTISGDTNDDLLEGIAAKPTTREVSDSVVNETENTQESVFVSPAKMATRDCSVLVLTPCLKISPPRTCIVLEPVSEFSHKENYRIHKCTPFPVGIQTSSGSKDSESLSSHVSEHLASKFPELIGIKPATRLENDRNLVEKSPAWIMSPPKSCVLMEPCDEKSLTLPRTSLVNQQQNFDNQGGHCSTMTYCTQGFVGKSAKTESTPLLKELESTSQKGRHPGENTLKKELWTKFEAASTHGIRFNVSCLHETAKKGFLDRLEEVSCDDSSPFGDSL